MGKGCYVSNGARGRGFVFLQAPVGGAVSTFSWDVLWHRVVCKRVPWQLFRGKLNHLQDNGNAGLLIYSYQSRMQ